MDLTALRGLLGPLVESLTGFHTHETIPEGCERFSLPAPPPETGRSKRERLKGSFATLPDTDLPRVAERFLQHLPPPARERNAIQDLLWADMNAPEVSKRVRREIARNLDITELFINGDRFDSLLDELWVLDDDPLGSFFGGVRGLRASIDQHVHRNPGDWSTEELFDRLGAFDASDRRFALFLEGLASPEVLPDEPAQRGFVETVNPLLRAGGVELRETDTDGGYPVFTIVSLRWGASRSPKNLIFASPGKPDIRFRSAVDNDIEIVGNADSVLAYDRPIGGNGLRWHDLQSWWKAMRGIESDDEAKATLYKRLLDSLPASSPPQILLFRLYHQVFGAAIPDLPALLPEVWLHWDPKTVSERGPDALLRFRMDFLLLLPHGQRVVLEVDGMHHYASRNGKADPAAYAKNMRADRDLKLSGYEVFRFGASELQDSGSADLVRAFFEAMFQRHEVTAELRPNP